MSRKTRDQVFDPSEVATVHVMNRVVRRCFLMGKDFLTGKNYDHRKDWLEDELERVAACFGIDCLNFAILSNHFHLILRSRPDVVQGWNNREVARRWLTLCPKGKRRRGRVRLPTDREINALCSDKVRLKELRSRLSDISWWMRLVCQHIAQWANREDNEVGKFWQSRFHAVRLLDEAAILAGAAYVDLNPLRAAIAQSLELCEHTSLQKRRQRLMQDLAMHCDPELEALEIEEAKEATACDSFLAPLEIDERAGKLGPQPSKSGKRASDKGFLAMTLQSYCEFVQWTADEIALRKRGAAGQPPPEILKRLGLSAQAWCGLVGGFRKLFGAVAGKPEHVDAHRNPRHPGPYYLPKATRELLQPQPGADSKESQQTAVTSP